VRRTRTAALAIALLGVSVVPAHAGIVSHVRAKATDTGGDGDGWIEPGEPFRLKETVANRPYDGICGIGAFPDCNLPTHRTRVHGTIAAPSSAFLFGRASARYHDLVEGGPAATDMRAFRGRVVPDARCGRFVPMALLLSSEEATDRVTFQLPIGVPTAPVSSESSDVPKQIEPVNAGQTESSLPVTQPGLVRDVDVRVDIDHPTDRNVAIGLRPPGPDYWEWLTTGAGGSGDDYQGTTFDDEAPTPVAAGHAPFTGRFNTGGRLAKFYGREGRGTWYLVLEDTSYQGGEGMLNAWGLDIRRSACSVAPRAKFRHSRAVAGRRVRFDASPSVGAIADHRWDFDGDGTYETGAGRRASVSHRYASAGTVTVGLKVTDRAGNESFYTRVLRVH
jgi:subtilisin-like proprotein convertase family protein